MAKELLINVSEGEECRIALLDDGHLDELYMERTSSTSHVGNIYKGRVTNVEPSIQAAFIDFGLGRNGFLHISDLMPKYFGRKGEEIEESVGRKMARRDRPPIQRCLRRGDEIVVQIIKEGIGTKGPTLSTYISIPGRILVMMPGMSKFGVSRKIEDEDERRRLRTILDSLKPIDDVGFIIRTAGIGKTKTEIQRDLTYLTRLWQTIEKKLKSGPGPMELYTEGDLVTRTVRDVFTTDIDRIVVDSKDVQKRVKDVIKITAPRTRNKVDLFDEPIPLFHKYGIEREIEQMYSRHVPLPSGGSLVIDSTEAIVAIDVNSGKFRDHADAETTAFRTDMEAADEIARQLKLRDLGGVIICDFIDLRFERHRRELERKLHDLLKKDRAKTKVLRMSQFGIIEMTRQRMRPSLKRSVYFDCPHCKGSGLVKTPESMSLDVMRRLAIAIHDLRVARVELTVNPDVAFYLLNRKRVQLADLEHETGKRVVVRSDVKAGLDDTHFDLFDAREGMVYLPELGMSPFGQQTDGGGGRRHGQPQHGGGGRGGQHQQHPRGGGRQRGGHPQGGQPRGGGGGGPPQQRRDEREREREREREEDRYDLDTDEEEGEQDQQPAPAAAAARGPDRRDQPRPPARSADDSDQDFDPADEEEDQEDSHVVEVDDAHEPMGEGPRAIDDDRRHDDRRHDDNGHGNGGHRRRRRRGRRGRGGRGGGQQGQGGGQGQLQQPARANDIDRDYGGADDSETSQEREPQRGRDQNRDRNRERPTQVTSQSTTEEYGSGEVETEEIEATFGDDEEGTPPVVASADEDDEGSPDEPNGNVAVSGENGSSDMGTGGKRRRRRRGGRRHRRRRQGGGEAGAANASGEHGDDTDSSEAEPSDEREEAAAVSDDDATEATQPEPEEATEESESPGNQRPSRGSRSRGGGGGRGGSRRPQRTPPPTPQQQSSPAKPSAATPPPPPVPRTGSTDRHLMHEDHVDTTHRDAPRRPSSRRDLDAIPDDFD